MTFISCVISIGIPPVDFLFLVTFFKMVYAFLKMRLYLIFQYFIFH